MRTLSQMKALDSSDNIDVFFDFGNTKIKWCENTINNELLGIHSCFHSDIKQAIGWLEKNKIATIHIAASRQTPALDSIIQYAKFNKISIHNIVVNDDVLKINYADSSQFGIDRYLNILAAKTLLNNNFCVISAGTAITIDFYTNKHIGGVIFPGIHSSLSILEDKTGLNQIERPNNLLGNNTKSAIGSGIYNGTFFAIKGFISSISLEYKTDFTIIITGGNAIDLKKLTKNINQSLLFIGINRYNEIDNSNIENRL